MEYLHLWLRAVNQTIPDLDPELALDFIYPRQTPRKLRLFAIACCRQMRGFLQGRLPRGGDFVLDLGEKLADGKVSPESLREPVAKISADQDDDASVAAAQAIFLAVFSRRNIDLYVDSERRTLGFPYVPFAKFALESRLEFAVFASICSASAEAAIESSPATRERDHAYGGALYRQLSLVEDIFGPPPSPSSTMSRAGSEAPMGEDAELQELARMVYDRDFSGRIANEAEAYEAIGKRLRQMQWARPDMIRHCELKSHVRGCWLIDEILGLSFLQGSE